MSDCFIKRLNLLGNEILSLLLRPNMPLLLTNIELLASNMLLFANIELLASMLLAIAVLADSVEFLLLIAVRSPGTTDGLILLREELCCLVKDETICCSIEGARGESLGTMATGDSSSSDFMLITSGMAPGSTGL